MTEWFDEEVSAEIHADTELWGKICARVAHDVAVGKKDPELAFKDAVNELVEVKPTVLVDGERVTAEDVPGVSVEREELVYASERYGEAPPEDTNGSDDT